MRVLRFNRTERLVHWVQAVTFLILLATGLLISVTFFEEHVGNRELWHEIHLYAAFFFVFGPAIIALAGDSRSIVADIDDVDSFSREDRAWLARPHFNPPAGGPRTGRFNAGQKLNTIFTAYCVLAFGATGFIIWQNRHFPYHVVSQANTIHSWLAYIALFVFLGHLYLSIGHPATRASLMGILSGSVPVEWAKRHHPAWIPSRPSPMRPANVAYAAILTLLGTEIAALIARLGFEGIGANTTDPLAKAVYRFSGWPGTLSTDHVAISTFDLAAAVYLGLAVLCFVGVKMRTTLLPRPLFPPTPRVDD